MPLQTFLCSTVLCPGLVLAFEQARLPERGVCPAQFLLLGDHRTKPVDQPLSETLTVFISI